jgi:hypothetical protein
MPTYMESPKDMAEVGRRFNLPRVIELREDGQKNYFLIIDTEKFRIDVRNTRSLGELYPDYANMKLLATRHGKAMTSDEFESGMVDLAFGRETGNVGYKEYMFQANEKNVEKKK